MRVLAVRLAHWPGFASMHGLPLVLAAVGLLFLFLPQLLNLMLWSPLHQASWEGDAARARALLGAGRASINATTASGDTPLHWAGMAGHAELVDLLLAHGASPDSSDMVGNTPLHWAAQAGHEEVAKMLLDRGAEASPRHVFGVTPLHRAAKDGHAVIVQLLINMGANPSSEDMAWSTPWDLAMANSHQDAADLLPGRGLGRDNATRAEVPRWFLNIIDWFGNNLTDPRVGVSDNAETKLVDGSMGLSHMDNYSEVIVGRGSQRQEGRSGNELRRL